LGCRTAIEHIREMIREGSGADRQLRVWRETGDLKKVVDYMAEETRAGL
jgi:carboxylate-amine ligase